MSKIFDLISRRHFLSGLLTSVGLVSIGVSFERQRRKEPLALDRPRVLNNPHYRKKKPRKYYLSNLAPGFYLNKRKESIIHLVNGNKRIRGVQKINETKLVRIDPLRNRLVPAPHVNRSTASYSLETAALAELTSNPPRPEIACQLLLLGIMDHLMARNKFRRGLAEPLELRFDVRNQLIRQKGRVLGLERVPARLYDLLAGLSVRYGNPRYLKNLISLVEGNPDLKEALTNRLSIWKDTKKPWHDRWAKGNIKWNKIALPKNLREESSKVR